MDEGLMTAGPAYRLDGALVARERFYRVACDPARSVVVEACAGAGKTWMLVSRILRALLDGAAPQEIVAITFTRKAAGEMRDRLSDWLREFSRAHSTPEARIQALIDRGMSAEQATQGQVLLGDLHAKLLVGGRAVEIRTFHAWFSQLLRAAPMELLQAQGLSPELQLVEDETDLIPELWLRFHGQVLSDAALLADYQALVAARGRSTVTRWLESAFSKRVELRLADAALEASMPGADSLDAVFAGLAHPVQALRLPAWTRPLTALAQVLGATKGATAQKAGSALEQALSLADDRAAFDAARLALFTATGSPRKNLGDSPLLDEGLERLTLLAAAIAQHEARCEHLQLVGLSRVLLSEYEGLKSSRGLVDMNDLERGALALLADADLSGWVQERLDARVRHVLIDEFQDTSPLQWHALYAWLSSYSGAGGGYSGQKPPAVFIVGDPKQSIYRFRRAEPRVFAAAREFVVQGLGGAVLECDHTRRNALPVLAAVNSVFEAAGEQGAYLGFRSHTTEVGSPSALDGLFVLADADEASSATIKDAAGWRPSLTEARHELEEHRRAAEARNIADAVQTLVGQGVSPGEIFVLARKREPLRVLAQALKAQELPHAAPEDTALLDAPDVRDLLALLDVLASPGHALSLAHALRSPLFGASEADLLSLADTARARPCSWWSALMTADAEASPALQRARTLLQRWSRLAGRVPPHDLLDRIVFEGDLTARLAAAVPPSERRQRLAAVDALLALVLDLDGGRYASVYSLVRALKKRALKLSWPSEPDAVQLLTVHGAKGLEARVVFLMDTDAAPTRAESATLAVDWPVQAAAPARVAFLASESRCPPALLPLLEDERQQRAREELNALYVAMTRARSCLVISRTPPRRAHAGTGNWWARLSPLAAPWPEARPEAAQARTVAQCTLLSLPALAVPPTLRAEAAPEDQALVPVADTAAIGEALHRALEWASGTQGAVWPFAQLVAAAGRSFDLSAKQQQSLERAAEAIWRSPDCAPFFDAASLSWAGNEVAINFQGQDLRIDRLVCRAEQGHKTWWVLDYKLHPAPERDAGYRAQLARYREAITQLQPGDAVRCAFITGQGRLLELEEI
nr:UvrD-helicase domain-containing protein [uncultured Roseateles sp.]